MLVHNNFNVTEDVKNWGIGVNTNYWNGFLNNHVFIDFEFNPTTLNYDSTAYESYV